VSDRLSPRPYNSSCSTVPISDGIDDPCNALAMGDVDMEVIGALWRAFDKTG